MQTDKKIMYIYYVILRNSCMLLIYNVFFSTRKAEMVQMTLNKLSLYINFIQTIQIVFTSFLKLTTIYYCLCLIFSLCLRL